jgi:Mlc titration factor MtfA (ptsG expression regulator)
MLPQALIILTLIAAAGAAAALILHARKARYRKLLNAPLAENYVEILEKNLPPYKSLTGGERERLHGLINVFLADKNFEGCGGLELTDEIRVTIAAQACMLLLNRETRVYPRLRTILVYPDTYVARNEGLFGQDTRHPVRLGESWHGGIVVLAWNSVKSGAANFDDGLNVAIHEFAHQLDQEDGVADGAPALDRGSAYRTWARVFQHEYEALQESIGRGGKSVLHEYGATNPAEFFAVATESFFEKPEQLKKKNPELFEELKSYYHTDPMKWEVNGR